MLTHKGGASRLAHIATGLVSAIGSLFKADARSNLHASHNLTRQLYLRNPNAFEPVLPLFYGSGSKGPHPRHPMFPHNHPSTDFSRRRNGAQECARRQRQIARGQLRRENGFAA